MNAPQSPHSLPLELPVFDNSFAALLGLPPELVGSPHFAGIFVGNRLLPGSKPLAAAHRQPQVRAAQLAGRSRHPPGPER